MPSLEIIIILLLILTLILQGRSNEVTQEVMDLLIVQQPNWGSKDWTLLFRTTLRGRLPQAHSSPIYRLALGCYHEFCHNFHILSPFSLSELVLGCLVAYLCQQEFVLCLHIRVYLSRICLMQITYGLQDPVATSFSHLEYVVWHQEVVSLAHQAPASVQQSQFPYQGDHHYSTLWLARLTNLVPRSLEVLSLYIILSDTKGHSGFCLVNFSFFILAVLS